jgi:beta-glucosidase
MQTPLPKNFIWGTATSAYQIEGAYNEDGRTPSHWDTFCREVGKVRGGDTGDIACDHYHRWREDIALMKDLGVNAYRFSVSWTRILPDGGKQANHKGLDFYSQLVDTLLENGITPWLTLYHWELPQPLQDKGGWTERFVCEHFNHLADVVSRQLGDRVKHWITQNEPWCISLLSHQLGVHAPGWQDWNAGLRAAHHILLSHGMAVNTLRQNVPSAQVGITLNFEHATPASPTPADMQAARIYDGYYNRWFLDPIFGMGYPADLVAHYQQYGHLPNGLDFVQDGDLEQIAVPTDFLGINNYTGCLASAPLQADGLPTISPCSQERTDIGWGICPDEFYNLLNRIHFHYRPAKMVITENGASYNDGINANGDIQDLRRISYLQQHLAAVGRAIQNGCPIAGYFVWSLLDNFEWSWGYSQRFGIVHVDYATQKRTPKASYHFYKNFIQSN